MVPGAIEAPGTVARPKARIAVSGGRIDVLSLLHWEVARTLTDRHDFMATMTECMVLEKLPGQASEGHACAAEAHLVWQRSTEALVETGLALAKDPRCYEAKLAENTPIPISRARTRKGTWQALIGEYPNVTAERATGPPG